ncbi:hypothetical protein BKD30_07950 [Tersicoccus phoenicis]|uniref:Uncharacterized protein n=1 Tax=Tersicoccus phoenicis TaxID=554083 RepID=A0A1R1LAY0_9MICC|nr:hypothetical protein [Tersicoccus phoenicis]OMH24692.1 hypothetical protein BKD30_07950 [Tersicoccus phoenicis]
MLTQMAAAVLSAAEDKAPVIAPPAVVMLVIFGVFLVLLFVTVSFTNVGMRHEAHDEHVDPQRTLPAEHHREQGH